MKDDDLVQLLISSREASGNLHSQNVVAVQASSRLCD